MISLDHSPFRTLAALLSIIALSIGIGTSDGGPDTNPTAACLIEARNSSDSRQTFRLCCEQECGGPVNVIYQANGLKTNGSCICVGNQTWSINDTSAVQCGRPTHPLFRPGEPEQRHVAGPEALRHSWPWHVSVQVKETHYCSGSLIDARHVVTVAHCVDRQSASNVFVKVGLHDMQNPESTHKTHKVEKIIMHPRWNKRSISSDISILRLKEPVQFNANVSAICLPEREAIVGKKCVTTGWGRATSNIHFLSQLTVPVVAREVCNDTQHHSGKIDDTMLCTGQDSRGFCHSDSGGPLVCQKSDGTWELQGAKSWGNPDCTEDNELGVYCRVHAFKTWISDNTKV